MVGKLQKTLIFLLAAYMTILFCVPVLAASEPQFRLDMDNLNLKKGVSSKIIVSIINAQGAEIISIEGMENFDVISQSQSSSTSVVGNNITYKVDISFTVMPKTAGQFILKANIKYNGQSYKTNELEVTVGEGSANTGEAGEDLFVKAILSQTEAYLGEKLVITYELYSRYNIDNLGFTDYTAIDGIIARDVPEDQLKAEYVYLDGIRYAKYEAKQLILDPIKPGVYTIPSFNLQVNVITDNGPGSVFGGGFGGLFNSIEPKYLQTEEKELIIKPLPSEGRPANFSGIVGELNLESNFSREQVNYGDSLSLQVTVSGNCNLDGFKNIFNGKLSGFTVYETLKNTTESIKDNQYNVQKEFDAILVPEKTGDIEIAPFPISFFNPVSEKYETVEIKGTTIKVLGEMPQPNFGGGVQATAFETVRIDQVSYTYTNDNYLTVQINKKILNGVLIGLILIFVFAAVLIWFFFSRKKHNPALKLLYKRLMGAKDKNEVYDIFNDIIKHCYKISLKASSKGAVQNSLPNAELAAKITDIMDYMESNEEKELSYLKNKIKGVYRDIL